MGWSVATCSCGLEAEATLVYVWEADGTEKGRSRPLCHAHYWAALDAWASIEEADPDVMDGLAILVSAP